MSDFFFSEDITYCMDGECLRTECIRHRSKAPIGVPLSWANMKYQEECLLEKIKALPSAEEMAFNEWCTDCKEYDHEKGCCPRFNRVIRETVEEVKEAHEEMRGRWIPIKTRPMDKEEREYWEDQFGGKLEEEDAVIFDCPMPKDGQEILVSYKKWICMDKCEICYGGLYGLEGYGDWEGVLAWMPAPKPWKGEDYD